MTILGDKIAFRLSAIYRRVFHISLYFLMLFWSVGIGAQEQADSIVDENFVIASVIVADPGDELYSAGGHAGLHMECPEHHLDFVFSYESEEISHKILSFLAGHLKMGMFAIPFEEYLEQYRAEGRGVRQYTLNLPLDMKRNLWRVLDNHVSEGANLPYDYLNRGCASTVLSILKESLGATPIEYGGWPETFSRLTRRELVENEMAEYPWSRSFLHLVGNGVLDSDCSNEEKVILPSDLVFVLQHATVNGKQLLSADSETLLPSNHHPMAHWCTPLLVAIVLLLLTIVCSYFKMPMMDYVLLTIQSLLGIVTTYLIFFSSLVCTEWSWLIIPFNPLPLLFWKWRRKWCLPYAVMIAVWVLVMWLWPHKLTDTSFTVLALALVISYLNIYMSNKKTLKK